MSTVPAIDMETGEEAWLSAPVIPPSGRRRLMGSRWVAWGGVRSLARAATGQPAPVARRRPGVEAPGPLWQAILSRTFSGPPGMAREAFAPAHSRDRIIIDAKDRRPAWQAGTAGHAPNRPAPLCRPAISFLQIFHAAVSGTVFRK